MPQDKTTPERDRLERRFIEGEALPDGSKRFLRWVHVTWGPKARKMTPEQRAEMLNEVIDNERP